MRMGVAGGEDIVQDSPVLSQKGHFPPFKFWGKWFGTWEVV